MMNWIRKYYKKIKVNLYLCHCTFFFGFTYVIFHILFFEPLIHIKKYQYLTSFFNRLWAKIAFFIWRLPCQIILEDPTEKRESVVYASNHFSFFDIPVLCNLPRSFKFVGKMQITRAPLFGRMFKHLHISYDRKKMRGAMYAYEMSLRALEEGRSTMFFPEGGIVYKEAPKMGLLKNGAFKVAISSQKPLVPVTIINSDKVMPVKHRLEFYYHPVTVIIHKAIEVNDLTVDDIPKLKNTYQNIVQSTLNQYYGNK